MRMGSVLIALLAALGAASCGETPPAENRPAGGVAQQAPAPQASAQPQVAAAPQQPGRLNSLSPAAVDRMNPAATPAAPEPAAAPPPPDARWTLLCYAVNGPNHVEDARELKASLIKKTNRNDWYVIHGRETSTLYFGYFRAIKPDETKDAAVIAKARQDQELVRQVELLMAGSTGQVLAKPFASAAFVPLASPDPTSRPEWNLAAVDAEKDPKDPTRAFWSLQIMAFRDNPLRKEAAVQAVEALRAKGEQAYYYHGESISSVCIGAFPPTAVKAQRASGDGAKEISKPSDIVVVTSEPLPDNMLPRKIDGKDVVAVSPQLEVVDKGLFSACKKYPEHAVNYEVRVRKNPKGGEVPDPSFLVIIPRPKGNGLYDDPSPTPMIGDSRTGTGLVNPTTPGSTRTGVSGIPSVQPDPIAPAQTGRLRRIGE